MNASDIDGLILPGGLGTWMIRGHPGLRALIRDVDQTGKPIVAVGRGPKLLLSAGVLAGRDVTCAPQMRDDLCHAVAGISCRDEPVVRDDNLWTCQRTDDLPDLMVRLLGQEP